MGGHAHRDRGNWERTAAVVTCWSAINYSEMNELQERNVRAGWGVAASPLLCVRVRFALTVQVRSRSQLAILP